MFRQTHYAILRIPENAEPTRIRHAFRALVRLYHPDTGMGSSAEKFRAVVEAYGVLIDPQTRREYDAALARSWQRNTNVVAEPLVPPQPNAESIYMHTVHPRHVAAYDPFFRLDQMLDEVFQLLNSTFAVWGW